MPASPLLLSHNRTGIQVYSRVPENRQWHTASMKDMVQREQSQTSAIHSKSIPKYNRAEHIGTTASRPRLRSRLNPDRLPDRTCGIQHSWSCNKCLSWVWLLLPPLWLWIWPPGMFVAINSHQKLGFPPFLYPLPILGHPNIDPGIN